jgi:hypothetical protein
VFNGKRAIHDHAIPGLRQSQPWDGRIHRGFQDMTNSNGNRVSLSAGDWIKIILFMLVQSTALIGVGIDMRERLAVVETQLKNREEGLTELREDIIELRNEMVSLRK